MNEWKLVVILLWAEDYMCSLWIFFMSFCVVYSLTMSRLYLCRLVVEIVSVHDQVVFAKGSRKATNL
jgi:hypothetical protein